MTIAGVGAAPPVDSTAPRRDAERMSIARPLGLLALAGALAAALAACAHTPQSCQARAEENYRHCVNPYTVVNQGESPQPVTGEEGQGCRVAYQQALDRCTGGPAAPIPELFPAVAVRASERSSLRVVERIPLVRSRRVRCMPRAESSVRALSPGLTIW